MARQPVPQEEVQRRKLERAAAKEKKRAENRAMYDAQRQGQGNKQSASIPLEIADKLSDSIDANYRTYADTDEDLESFKNAAHDYMDLCDSCRYPIYRAGVALACGISEDDLVAMVSNKFYAQAASIVMTRISAYAQRMLYMGYSATGPIFALKQHNWTDKVEQIDGAKGKGDLSAKSESDLVNEFVAKLKDAGLVDFAEQFAAMYMPVKIEQRTPTSREE